MFNLVIYCLLFVHLIASYFSAYQLAKFCFAFVLPWFLMQMNHLNSPWFRKTLNCFAYNYRIIKNLSPRDLVTHLRLLDLSPSCTGQHIGHCVSSNHLCPPPRQEHLPTSVPILTGLRGWSPANFSSVFLFPFFLPESCSSLVWLFYSCSFWSHDPTTSVFSFWWCSPAHPVLFFPWLSCLIFYPSTRHAISAIWLLTIKPFATVIGHVSAPYSSFLSWTCIQPDFGVYDTTIAFPYPFQPSEYRICLAHILCTVMEMDMFERDVGDEIQKVIWYA